MVTIRQATVDDAAVIAEIYNQSIAAGDSTMDDVPKTADAIRQQIEAFSEREMLLVLDDSDRTVGWAAIRRYSPKGGYRVCGETSIFLRRSLVRRGYGSRLQRALVERCRALGYHHLVARMFADNTASIAFHRAHSYEMVGIQRQIGWVGGHWQDVAVMQCVLGDVPPYEGP